MALALSLPAASLSAAVPDARWVLEMGSAQARPGELADPDCSPSEAAEYFLACGQSRGLSSDAASSWALGFDTRLVAVDGGGAWWGGFRAGRAGPLSLDGGLSRDSDARLKGQLRSDYALLLLRREFAQWGPLRPRIDLGVGVARNNLSDLQWRSDADQRRTADADSSGYLLRLSLGVDWPLANGMVLGLGLRHDALDGMRSGDAGPEDDFPAVRARLAVQSAVFSWSIPFGDI